MCPSWQQKYDLQEKEFQKRQEVIGEIESRNNLNGGISRHLGMGDGRPGLEWTGLELEYDHAQRHIFGGWPLWLWVLLAAMLITGLAGIYFQNSPGQGPGTAGQPGQNPPTAGAPQTP